MTLRFPLNIMLLPLSICEGLLRWMVIAGPAVKIVA